MNVTKGNNRAVSDFITEYYDTYKSICKDGELSEDATCKDYLQVQKEGDRKVQREIKYIICK